jgi:hypothetical protein
VLKSDNWSSECDLKPGLRPFTDKTDLHARVNWALAEKPFEHGIRNNWQALSVMTAIGGYPTPLIKGMRALKWH